MSLEWRMIVCGSRDWTDQKQIEYTLDWVVKSCHPVIPIKIIHGACATGADSLAHNWIKARGYAFEMYPANWTTHDNAAGPIRNKEMAKLGADVCVAFLKGKKSKGTLDMIDNALAYGIPTIIIPSKEFGAGIRGLKLR
jgi:hypothetical protein